MADNGRLSFTKEERREAFENTDKFFRQKDLADRQARESKTQKLRAARIALEESLRDAKP